MTETVFSSEDALQRTRTGDVFFMNRKCLAMRSPLAAGLCALHKTENRFDHVGMILKLTPGDPLLGQVKTQSPSNTYVLETNMKGVTLFSAEERMRRTSAHEVMIRPLHTTSPAERQRIRAGVDALLPTPYECDLTSFFHSIVTPPDKQDRIMAAQKMMNLTQEVDALRMMAAADSQRGPTYRVIARGYIEAASYLAQVYFPQLPAHMDRNGLHVAMDWGGSNEYFGIDGFNERPRMVCSELLCNLLRRSGIICGYVPASTMRPFDYLDDSRLNFLEFNSRLGSSYWIKPHRNGPPASRSLAFIDEQLSAAEQESREHSQTHLTEAARVNFINDVFRSVGLPVVHGLDAMVDRMSPHPYALPTNWLVQSATWDDTMPYLWMRMAGVGVIFSCINFCAAPLSLRYMEGQAGLILVRGSMWSLATGVLTANLCFCAVQALSAIGITSLVAQKFPVREDGVLLQGPSVCDVVDCRHPFYTVAGTWLCSSLLAHLVCHPMVNASLAYHFGPARAAASPPWRALLRGTFLTAPCAMLVPYTGCWLGWYESVGSFVIPTSSSVLRPRPDLLQRPEWPHYRRDALLGAFAATIAIDAVAYGLTTRSQRRMLSDLYAPQKCPSYGRSLFPLFRYRLAANAVVFSLTSSLLHAFDKL